MTRWSPRITSVVGRFANASNATLLATDDEGSHVVYKPQAGEEPLWDFAADTLALREVMTYELSAAMGLGVVPETVLGDGPYGPGSVQRFVDIDERFDVLGAVRTNDHRLWSLAVLDVITNNADRKLGHILKVGDRVLGIDHGLTFHPDDKLRTVLWGFAGAAVPDELLAGLDDARRALGSSLGQRISALLGSEERAATTRRVERLLESGVHPQPPTDRHPLPWPPY